MKTVHSVSTPLIKTIYPSHSTQVAGGTVFRRDAFKKNRQEEKKLFAGRGVNNPVPPHKLAPTHTLPVDPAIDPRTEDIMLKSAAKERIQ